MPRTVQHILANLEVTPPAGLWQQLAGRLDTEYDPLESVIAQKIEQWEAAPPPASWAFISEALNEAPAAKKPARLIPLPPFRKMAVAALVLGILVTASWFLLNSGSSSIAPVSTGAIPAPLPPTAAATPPPTPIAAAPDMPLPQKQQRSAPRRQNSPAIESNNELAAAYAAEIFNDLRATDTRATTTTIDSQPTPPVSVSARPFRDASGRLILDRGLLTSPGNNYVVVTSPNGEQTRISSKFLPMLTALNGSSDNSYGDSWKKRFGEWRDKLLQQATFAPSAVNFLDIMELKEMIEEK